MMPSVLILPGFGNSGEAHWQSLWEQGESDFKRVVQKDWLRPVCHEWVLALENALKETNSDVVLVAHSMACLVLAQWASNKHHASIKGALIVAPPNPKETTFPKEAIGFEQIYNGCFDFPSIVVASTNDEYATLEYAKNLAKSWGSEFVDVGPKGHINANSALGFWDEGWDLLVRLRE